MDTEGLPQLTVCEAAVAVAKTACDHSWSMTEALDVIEMAAIMVKIQQRRENQNLRAPSRRQSDSFVAVP